MKALSLLQPWATLVVMGVKTIETRSWNTNYRGELLIHASNGKAGELFAADHPFKKYIPDFKKLPFGAIIGRVVLRDVIRLNTGEMFGMSDASINRLTLEEKVFGDYTEGRYAWMLEDAVQFNRAYPAKGSLVLWNIDFKEDDLV